MNNQDVILRSGTFYILKDGKEIPAIIIEKEKYEKILSYLELTLDE